MKTEKIAILANAASRTLNRAELAATASHINRFLPCETIFTTSIENARETAQSLSADPACLVAACGGDGTIHTVINSVVPEAITGIIPAGTANVIARELGIPVQMREAGKLLLTGAAQKCDLGTCNGRKFIFVAGIGFDAVVADAVSPTLKKLFGRYAYHIAGLQQFCFYRPPTLRIRVDDGPDEFTGRFAIFANMRRYGGDLFFAPDARYDDGILNMVLVEDFSMRTMLQLLNFARRNGPQPPDGVRTLTGRKFHVTASEPAPYQLDGEVFAAAAEFTIGSAEHQARLITS
ncbi:hypothetical protein MASR1M12_01790 [Erysipelotrichia bacterium]